MGKDIGLLRRIWNRLFDHMMADQHRALSTHRMSDQLWVALNPDESDWSNVAWPLAIYVDGPELFAIYTQGGRLFRVDLSVSGDTLTIGQAIQVTEAFPAVAQSRGSFMVTRQADGQYRWTMIASTSVLNRVAEIDSYQLYDSFIEEAQRTGEYPRLDFYHLGSADEEAWEFGTADYLARDGVCYIASGLFDDHPLARATITATERDPGVWGASIEFKSFGKPELIAVEPVEVKVPVFRKGKNTRISIVKEVDAACHFTTLGISREVVRMRSDILEKLSELYGDDEEAQQFLEEFGLDVDRVNRTVTEQGLIHRTKKGAKTIAQTQPVADGEEADAEEREGDPTIPPPLEIDEEAATAIAAEVIKLDLFTQMHTALNTQSEQLTVMTQVLEASQQESADLKARVTALAKRLKALEREEVEKQAEWIEDLPAARTQKVTFRPRYHDDEPGDEDDANDPLSAENIRAKVLGELTPVQ